MNFIKKNFKLIVGIIIGAILISGISVYATTTYLATQVTYKDGKSVAQALDELYTNSHTKSFNFDSSLSTQTFNLGFRPNYISFTAYFSDGNYYVNVIYNKDIDTNKVVRSNGDNSEKMDLSTWVTLTDNGFIWNVDAESWNGKNVYCTACK